MDRPTNIIIQFTYQDNIRKRGQQLPLPQRSVPKLKSEPFFLRILEVRKCQLRYFTKMHGKVQEGECIPWFLRMSDIFKDVFKTSRIAKFKSISNNFLFFNIKSFPKPAL